MNLFSRNRKGQTVGGLLPLGITFVVLAIALGLGATVLTDIQAGQTAESRAANVSGQGLVSLTTIGDYLPTIALVTVVAVILGIIIVYLARRFG